MPLIVGSRKLNRFENMTEERKRSLHPTSRILLEVYKHLFKAGQVSFFPTDENLDKLDTIVKTVESSYFGTIRFPSLEERAVAYLCLIIKNHPVVDGNKRLAILWLEIFCEALNLKIKRDVPLDVLAVSIEADKETDLGIIIKAVSFILFGNK